jgi:phage N-6-adenine-methyltransferase
MRIDKDFKNLIPPLSAEEYHLLETSIITEGCRDALVCWQGSILDGHNRYEICKKHDLPYNVTHIDFPDRQSAIVWIIKNQFGRRNLSAFVRAELALRLKPLLARKAGRPRKDIPQISAELETRDTLAKIAGRPRKDIPQISAELETRDTLAKIAGVSHDTINRVQTIIASGNDGLLSALRNNEISINQAYDTLKGKPHLSQGTGQNEWYTPSVYIEAAREVLGQIDLDPASCDTAQKTVKAKTYYTAEDDGLTKKWNGKIWLNPPFGKGLIDKFINKAVAEAKEAIILTHNATDTKWFQSLAGVASAMCFTAGRINFYADREDNNSSPLQGQCFIYIGKDKNRFIKVFSPFGFCVGVL